MEITVFKSIFIYEKRGIWIKPFCDFFGLDVRNQHKKIKNDPILKNLVEKNTPDFGDVDKNGRILLTKKGFIRWIQIINPNIVNPDLRQSFILFQEKVFDFIYGSIDEKEIIATKNQRLEKLKKLEKKIKQEIKICENQISSFIKKDFQYTLNI